MIKRIAHIGIAVKDLDKASGLFSKLFSSGYSSIEFVPDQKVRVVSFHIGETRIELTEGTEDDSPTTKFIEKRGEGIHHIAFEVENIEAELKRLKTEGFQLIDETPRSGADGCLIAFLHPKSTNGVLVEIIQRVVG